MPNFDALIERVIASEMRENLATFLNDFEYDDGERAGKLDRREIGLVIDAMDAFLVDPRFADVGMAEFPDLCERLTLHASQEGCIDESEAVRIRNACFDALVCIKALEVRLARQVKANGVLRKSLDIASLSPAPCDGRS